MQSSFSSAHCLPSHLTAECLVSSGLYQYGLNTMQLLFVSCTEHNLHILHQQPPTAIPTPTPHLCLSVGTPRCFLYKLPCGVNIWGLNISAVCYAVALVTLQPILLP